MISLNNIKERIESSPSKLWFKLSALAYFVACLVPCAITDHEILFGGMCLLIGAMSVFSDWWQLAIWSSNILFFASYVRSLSGGSKKVNVLMVCVALLLASTMFGHQYITYDHDIPAQLHVGFYLWLASYVLIIPATMQLPSNPRCWLKKRN